MHTQKPAQTHHKGFQTMQWAIGAQPRVQSHSNCHLPLNRLQNELFALCPRYLEPLHVFSPYWLREA